MEVTLALYDRINTLDAAVTGAAIATRSAKQGTAEWFLAQGALTAALASRDALDEELRAAGYYVAYETDGAAAVTKLG